MNVKFTPYLVRNIGKDNIPEPIAVPANKNIALNCFFILITFLLIIDSDYVKIIISIRDF